MNSETKCEGGDTERRGLKKQGGQRAHYLREWEGGDYIGGTGERREGLGRSEGEQSLSTLKEKRGCTVKNTGG